MTTRKRRVLAPAFIIILSVVLMTLFAVRVLPEDNEGEAVPVPVLKPDMSMVIDSYIKEYELKGWFSGSILAANKEGIILNKGYGKANYEVDAANTPDTKFHLGSITKQFTAMAIMQLEEKGLLNVENSLSKYIPDYPNGRKITIHHLLTHTSGIPDYINDDKTYDDISRLYHSADQIVNRFKNKPLEFQPGTRYEYSNSGYVLLSIIIEKVSGKKYNDYLAENIFRPLGMNNTGYDDLKPLVKNRASGYSIIDGKLYNAEYFDRSNLQGADGLYSTTGDLYIWDRALYTERLVKKETLNKIFTPYAPAKKYGYGWTTKDGIKMSHTGRMDGFFTCISRDTENESVVIILSNLQQAPVVAICSDIESIMGGGEYKAPSDLSNVDMELE